MKHFGFFFVRLSCYICIYIAFYMLKYIYLFNIILWHSCFSFAELAFWYCIRIQRIEKVLYINVYTLMLNLDVVLLRLDSLFIIKWGVQKRHCFCTNCLLNKHELEVILGYNTFVGLKHRYHYMQYACMMAKNYIQKWILIEHSNNRTSFYVKASCGDTAIRWKNPTYKHL